MSSVLQLVHMDREAQSWHGQSKLRVAGVGSGAGRGRKMGKERESPLGTRVAGAQHQRLPCVRLRASWAHPASLCRRMGCVRSKFFQDRGKVSKSEPSASPHSPVYVPDPTSPGKRVSGGQRGGGPGEE